VPTQARERSRIVRTIQAYLDANPAAADTLDGIAGAWLGGCFARGRVEEALEHLVRRGAMAIRILPDESALFSRAPRGAP